MNYNRKTFRFLKIEKSGDFARRKNDVEGKMLDTKLKVMEKEERCIRQKLFEIRREKYSRSFYKSPERARDSKFVDVNVCETDEGDHENNKFNLISASGVERTKSSLRRKSSVVEELSPGQVVRVCVSSKLEDKMMGDESSVPSGSFPPIGKAKFKRRNSVAIVTDIGRHNATDLFTSLQSYMQTISEGDVEQVSKDDLYCGRKAEEGNSEPTFKENVAQGKFTFEGHLDCCSKQNWDLTSQENSNKDTSSCSDKDEQKNCSIKKVSISSDSRDKILKPGVEKVVIDKDKPSCLTRPRKRAGSQTTNSRPASSLRPQSSRSYSDSCVEEKSERSAYRKCSTPLPLLSKRYSKLGFVDPNTTSAFRLVAEDNPNMLQVGTVGLKRRVRSLTAPATSGHHRDSTLTKPEEQMAEQVLIRQLEIQTAADKMRKLSLQHFGDSKNTIKVRRQSSSTSPFARRRIETPSNEPNNNSEALRPGMVRRHTDDPQALRKFVKKQYKKETAQNTMESVLSGLSGDMPDCRYLRCDQVE